MADLADIDPALAAKVAVVDFQPGAQVVDRYGVRWITATGGLDAEFDPVDDIAGASGLALPAPTDCITVRITAQSIPDDSLAAFVPNTPFFTIAEAGVYGDGPAVPDTVIDPNIDNNVWIVKRQGIWLVWGLVFFEDDAGTDARAELFGSTAAYPELNVNLLSAPDLNANAGAPNQTHRLGPYILPVLNEPDPESLGARFGVTCYQASGDAIDANLALTMINLVVPPVVP